MRKKKEWEVRWVNQENKKEKTKEYTEFSKSHPKLVYIQYLDHADTDTNQMSMIDINDMDLVPVELIGFLIEETKECIKLVAEIGYPSNISPKYAHCFIISKKLITQRLEVKIKFGKR